jgi:hypothetical protein
VFIMKKRILVISIISCILIIGLPHAFSKVQEHALKDKQEKLAKDLGAKIEDYPVEFPVGYFYGVLKPGMTLDEVHNIVQGYGVVYNCWGFMELYYYFGKTENDAIRFALTYDEQGHYDGMKGEDRNSRILGLSEGCYEGLLEIDKLSP